MGNQVVMNEIRKQFHMHFLKIDLRLLFPKPLGVGCYQNFDQV